MRALRPSRSSRGQYSTSSTAMSSGRPPGELGATDAAGCGRSHAGRLFRRHDVEVDADAEARRLRGCDGERIVEHRFQAAAAYLVHVEHAHAEPIEALGLLRLEAAHADERHVARVHDACGEAVEKIVVLAEQPGERHAVQPAGGAGARRVGVHVRVDPDQPEVPVVHCPRHAGPRAAGAAMVAAEHAGQPPMTQRVGDRRGEQPAQLAHGELLAPLARRGLEDRPGHDARTAAREPLDQKRRERRGSLRAPGVRPAEAPGCADQLDLSFHRYRRFRRWRHSPGERRASCHGPIV